MAWANIFSFLDVLEYLGNRSPNTKFCYSNKIALFANRIFFQGNQFPRIGQEMLATFKSLSVFVGELDRNFLRYNFGRRFKYIIHFEILFIISFIYYLAFLVDDARLLLPFVIFHLSRSFYSFQSSPRSVKLKMVLCVDIIFFHLVLHWLLISILPCTFFSFLSENIFRGYSAYAARPLNHLNILMEKVPVSRFSKHVHNSLVRSEIYISSRNGSLLP